MKKLVKLSLVAAVAVAGFSTSASASSMENAIKNTTIGGYVRYRFNNLDVDNGDTKTTEQVKVLATIKSKVNDNITAVVQGLAVNNQENGNVANGPMNVTAANFVYTNGAATVITGLQALATPWTDAADGARANGVLGTYNLGMVTLAGAYFRDNRMGGDRTADLNGNELEAVAAIGKAGPVAYQAWYLNISKKVNDGTTPVDSTGGLLNGGGDAVALLVNGKFGPVAVDASYASLDPDETTLSDGTKLDIEKQTLAKVIASANLGVVTLVGGYAVGGDDGDLVTFDQDAKVGFQSWEIRAGGNDQLDLDAYTLAAVAPVGPVSLKVQYTDAQYDTAAVDDVEADETLFQVSYKMSKNFSSYLRYAIVDINDNGGDGDYDKARIELKYTF